MTQDIDWQALGRSAEKGDVDSMVLLGMRAGARGEPAVAERWLREAAAAGDTYSKVLIGGLLAERGRIDEAVPFWQDAAEAGDTDAEVLLAMFDPSDPGKTRFKVEYRNDNGLDDARVQCSVTLNQPQQARRGSGRFTAWLKALFTNEASGLEASDVSEQRDLVNAAVAWYEQRDYKVVDRSFRGDHLVVFLDGRFVFCEVARRTQSALGAWPDAATIENRKRIQADAKAWLAELTPSRLRRLGLNRATNIDFRFDLVSVLPHGVEVIEGCY